MSRATRSGVPPDSAMRSTIRRQVARSSAAPAKRGSRPPRPCAPAAVGEVGAARAGSAPRTARTRRPRRRRAAMPTICVGASSTIDLPSGRLVGRARPAPPPRPAQPRSTAGSRLERVGHAVAEGDRAGLVEQERVDVARRLDRAARLGDHVGSASAGPCRRCRSPRAARRSWSGSGSRAARSGSDRQRRARHRWRRVRA